MSPEQLEAIRATVLRGESDLRAEAETLLREVDRLLGLNQRVTETAISLLGSDLCEPHRKIVRWESFDTFSQKMREIGCTRCLKERCP